MEEKKEVKTKKSQVLGIDLGTTFIKVAQWGTDGAHRLPIDGDDAMASTVAFHQDFFLNPPKDAKSAEYKKLILCGVHAENKKTSTAAAVVAKLHILFDAKRFLGRRLYSQDVNRIADFRLPFPIVSDQFGNAVFRVVMKDGEPAAKGVHFHLKPQQVSAALLSYATKAVAGQDSGPVQAVITIPAAFTDSQRQATKEAAMLAGIDVLRLLPEPTAAAIGYFASQKSVKPDGHYLVFDFGGGTHDVALIHIVGNTYKVLGVDGDTLLGGRDIDERMFRAFVAECERADHSMNLEGKGLTEERTRQITLQRNKLRTLATNAKKALTTNASYPIAFADFDVDSDAELRCDQEMLLQVLTDVDPITRSSMMDRLFVPVNNVLKRAGLDKKVLRGVIMAGGSSQIPAVRQAVAKEFKDVPILYREAGIANLIAEGAAYVAHQLSASRTDIVDEVAAGVAQDSKAESKADSKAESKGDSKAEDTMATPPGGLSLQEATPDALGLAVVIGKESDILDIVIKRDSNYPIKVTKNYGTVRDNQDGMNIEVYRGEKRKASDNELLDTVQISGLPRLPAGQARADVTYRLDENGILQVDVVDKSNAENAVSKKIEVTFKARTTEADLKAMQENPAADVTVYPEEIQRELTVLTQTVYMALYKLSKPGLRYEERKQLRRDLGPSETFVHGFHGSQISLDDVRGHQQRVGEVLRALDVDGGGGAAGTPSKAGAGAGAAAAAASPAGKLAAMAGAAQVLSQQQRRGS